MTYSQDETQNPDQENFAYIKIEKREYLFTIRLNRPEKKNAMNPGMVNEIAFALSHAHFNKEIRAVIIEAEGNVFCAGADLKSFGGMTDESSSTIKPPASQILIGEEFNGLYKPCIACVEGDVYAGGFLILCGCTHVLAIDSAKFGLPEVKRGLFPFQVMAGMLELMPARKVLDWCIRGAVLSAEEALETGLITQVHATDKIQQAVRELASEITSNSPMAIRMGLEAFQELKKRNRDEHHAYLMGKLMETLQTSDAREGILAFREKSKANWKGE